MLGSDCRAVEGLPLKLMITAIVLAITVPLMFGALKSYDEASTRQELESEINDFISTVQNIYTAGPGNSVIVQFQVPGGALSGVDYVRFGDGPGGNLSSVVRYKMTGSHEVMIVVSNPNVPMVSRFNCSLEILPGGHSIHLECLLAEEDLNTDGLMPDRYVLLELSDI